MDVESQSFIGCCINKSVFSMLLSCDALLAGNTRRKEDIFSSKYLFISLKVELLPACMSTYFSVVNLTQYVNEFRLSCLQSVL